jgi:hypothetical protein
VSKSPIFWRNIEKPCVAIQAPPVMWMSAGGAVYVGIEQ